MKRKQEGVNNDAPGKLVQRSLKAFFAPVLGSTSGAGGCKEAKKQQQAEDGEGEQHRPAELTQAAAAPPQPEVQLECGGPLQASVVLPAGQPEDVDRYSLPPVHSTAAADAGCRTSSTAGLDDLQQAAELEEQQEGNPHAPQQQDQPPVEQGTLLNEMGMRQEGEEEEEEEMQLLQRDGNGLTEYERQRLERIRRNQQQMQAMGLTGPIAPLGQPAAAARRPQPARRRPPKPEEAAVPVRRSSRRGADCTGADTAQAASAVAAASAPQEDAPLVFDDSSVQRYVCEVLAGGPQGGSSSAGGSCREPREGSSITGFAQLPGCLADSALSRAYSVDWRPGLVVAGGKDGVVSIFGSRQLESGSLGGEDELESLLSHKLHKGWVSDVQFVSSQQQHEQGASLWLLTAGNDGTLCLWDAGRAAAQGRSHMPQRLAQAADIHAGGIFSMHELGGRVLTASKDCTVAVTALSSSGGLEAVQTYEELHDGVIKCARWRDPDVFASCGNDRRVCVADVRQPPIGACAAALEGAHSTAANCLRWHPSREHLLLSTSHDPHIALHDLRSPAQPLFTFSGHSQQGRIAGIYQPAFVAGGDAIATSAERSWTLSLYCTKTGSTISRGAIDFAAGATFCGKGRTDPLLCTATKAVYMLQPQWAAKAAAT